jgi:regulator of RNase E activity RraA
MEVTGVIDDVIEGLRALPTASVSDALVQLGSPGTMEADIKPVVTGKLVGPAVTVLEERADGAGAPTHALEAIDTAAAGSVVVIGVERAREVAVWGGLMTAGAAARGLAGAVLDGAARDVEEIERDFGMPVYARAISPKTTVGTYRTVAHGVPVECGGIRVSPGDFVVADRDGVVVVPAGMVEQVLAVGREIEERERQTTERIRALGSISKAVAEFNRI